MTIQGYIDGLKSKPAHVRKKAAFWWSFGLTAIIAVFWLGSMTGIHIKSGDAANAIAAKAGPVGDSMLAAVGGLAGGVWDWVYGPKKVTYSEIQVTPGAR